MKLYQKKYYKNWFLKILKVLWKKNFSGSDWEIDLTTYYNVGKLLSEAGKHYGEGIIKEYSNKLSRELNKKYETRTLFRMRQFYLFVNTQKVSPLVS